MVVRTRWNVLAAGALTIAFGALMYNLYWPAGEPVDHGCGTDPPGPAALVAVDAESGELLWSRRVGHASVVVRGDGVVAVGGFGGALRGIDASNGEIVWCSDTGRGSEGGLRVAAAGQVLAFYSPDDHVVGLDPTTGTERWRTPINQRDSAVDSPGPTVQFDSAVRLIGGDVLMITDGAADASVLMAMDPDTGRELKPSPAALPGIENIAVFGGWRLVASHSPDPNRHELLLELIDTETGSQLWSRAAPGYLASLALTSDGNPLVVVVDQSGGTATTLNGTLLSVYSGDNGYLVWQQSIDRGSSGVYPGKPGTVVVSSGQQLSAFSTDTSEVQWAVDSGNPGRQRPYTETGVYVDVVYMPGQDAYIGIVTATRPYRD